MLIRESDQSQPGVVVIMSDTAIFAASAKSSLLEIAKQATALGVGLQNAAPGDKAGMPNPSIQYLLDVSEVLTKIAEDCNQIMTVAMSTDAKQSPPSLQR